MSFLQIGVLCALVSILSYIGLLYFCEMMKKDQNPLYTILALFCIVGTFFPIGYIFYSIDWTITEATTTTEIVSEETVSNEIMAEESNIEETIVEETQETTKSAEEDPVIIKYQRYAYTEYLNDMEPGSMLNMSEDEQSKIINVVLTPFAMRFLSNEANQYTDFYKPYYNETFKTYYNDNAHGPFKHIILRLCIID